MIDVLIPTYARTRELGEALWCVLNQTIETRAVVLNDCPWQTLTCGHPRVVITNRPCAFANLGRKRAFTLWLARSPLVMWQDDDDLCLPWHAERMIGAMREGVIAACSPSCWYLDGMKWRHGSGAMEVIARREDATACGFPETDTGEDQGFTGRLRARGPVGVVAGEKSYVYRWNNGTHHVSGSGDPMGGVGFRAEAEERRARGREPSGEIEIVPRLMRDYFADHPMRDRLPANWLAGAYL